MSALLEQLNQLDQSIFLYINQLGNSFLDELLPIWRDKKTWIPLYALMLIVVSLKMKKKAILWILFFIASVAFADIISSHIFKPNFNRLRPCQIGSGIENIMTLRLSNCPGNGSFTSSHAANHFAMAFFTLFSMKGISRYWKWSFIFIIWATIICWAQIYVGVHYPGDILGGAILAFVLAFSLNKLYLILHSKFYKK